MGWLGWRAGVKLGVLASFSIFLGRLWCLAFGLGGALACRLAGGSLTGACLVLHAFALCQVCRVGDLKAVAVIGDSMWSGEWAQFINSAVV